MVTIKYSTGEMQINTQGYLNSKNATVEKFNALINMSIESDRTYATNAIEEWAAALNEAIDETQETVKLAEHEHKANVKCFMQTAKERNWDDAKLLKKINTSRNKLDSKLKKIAAQKRKYEKFRNILENICAQTKKGE